MYKRQIYWHILCRNILYVQVLIGLTGNSSILQFKKERSQSENCGTGIGTRHIAGMFFFNQKRLSDIGVIIISGYMCALRKDARHGLQGDIVKRVVA